MTETPSILQHVQTGGDPSCAVITPSDFHVSLTPDGELYATITVTPDSGVTLQAVALALGAKATGPWWCIATVNFPTTPVSLMVASETTGLTGSGSGTVYAQINCEYTEGSEKIQYCTTTQAFHLGG